MKNQKAKTNGFIPNSIRFISSCIKTVSTNVRSAGASVSGSISGYSEHQKDQVLWACFDKLELGPAFCKHVLLLGYSNGFQVLDVEDASNVSELVSRRDDPVTFLQIQPIPAKSEGCEGFRASHPLLLVVAIDDKNGSGPLHGGRDGLVRDGFIEPQVGNLIQSPRAVRFYSLRSHNYVHVLRFRSTVYMVRCSPRIVAVGLAAQIYCFDALTLENKFSVLTYPIPFLGGQGMVGVNIGYGPMAVGPRWLAYASNSPMLSNTGRLSPQSLTPPGVSPSTSPSGGNLVARYAMESSKQLASGLINLGDIGYKTFSKYCQDLLPDGSSSPVSSNSSWKVGRTTHSTEAETAGMVVIKDLVSRAVVSQFRAHTSPISALCFDPSGTLLVTASVHGNNINIFRIMPSCSRSVSGTLSYNLSSSHVHLYKLHRGMTSAVIQDICFSHYSQWIAIVSSRGTCHLFVLSPFGGEAGLQVQSSHADGPKLLPALSLPWWYTPSFLINQQSFPPPPPPPVTLSVVSRIKNGHSGWLNTVSNAASSAAGKVSIPSGAVAAVFHSSVPLDSQPAHLRSNSLEHLLAYTPCGHVIQHALLPSIWGEQSETASRNSSSSLGHVQDEELHVKVEPIQWWDVCRRTDWPEKEECVPGIALAKADAAEVVMDTSDWEDNNGGDRDSVKPYEQSHLYLSNVEVQIASGRIPIWQKSKIHFYSMSPLGANERNVIEGINGGEIEIEKVLVYEVDIRRKDLLPAFDHFHRLHSNWSDRGFYGGRFPNSSSELDVAKGKFPDNANISHHKSDSPCFADNSDGSSRTEGFLDSDVSNSHPSIVHAMNENDGEKRRSILLASYLQNKNSLSRDTLSISTKQSSVGVSPAADSCSTNSDLSAGRTIVKAVQPSNSTGTSDISNASSNRSDLSMNSLDEGPVHEGLDFEPFFQEEYCKASTLDESHELTEAATDVDSSSSPCDREKSEEDGDNDDMLGGVFAFCEEG